jgi:hypothetical protein
MTHEEEIKRIRVLYPKLTDKECEEAAENLRQYLLLAWEIWEEGQAKHQGNSKTESA